MNINLFFTIHATVRMKSLGAGRFIDMPIGPFPQTSGGKDKKG